MRPAVKNFTFRRGDTPSPLGVRLSGISIRSGAIYVLPRLGDVVTWIIAWPGDKQTRTTAPNGGLVLDARSKFITWPLTADDLARLQDGQVAPFAVRRTDTSGFVRTYLTGIISVEDPPV